MISRRVPHLIGIHFSIDGRKGTLQAANIAATFHFLTVLVNSVDYRLWPHPLPREMVRILSKDVTVGSILFRRQLLPSMLLIDHTLQSNLFPLQHTAVQRRGAILEALYRISKGFWFNPVELFMTSLFHFGDKVHRRNLTRAESLPHLFPRLLCQVLEHMGFPAEPQLERRQHCEAILTVDRWHLLTHAQNLPLQDIAEDIAVDHPVEDTEEPQIAPSAVTHPHPLPAAGVTATPQKSPAVTSNEWKSL